MKKLIWIRNKTDLELEELRISLMVCPEDIADINDLQTVEEEINRRKEEE
jgi:hypothetical protein